MPLYRDAFRELAALRSAPAFHPDGVLYEGRAEVRGPGPLPLGEVDCLVRLSKGIGTPRGVPDLLGIAVRLLHEPPVDFLCTTGPGSTGWRRFVLRPSRRWARSTLTSLMYWRAPHVERLHVLVDVPDTRLDSPDPDVLIGRLPVRLGLRVVGRDGDVQVGTIEVTRRSDLDRPAFDPVLHPPAGWRLGPAWLASLRERAYVGSRAGQGIDATTGRDVRLEQAR
ncbi:hypothetical protein SFC79_12705 [Nocardioides sp. S-58]|uniref:Phosphodiesterase n=1 Tax=Nocardioides renjunii TaxID=3095075 RepID=A0ABU5KCH2_9ACTN|nr:hypothetical protein [Nocardioides sp. S-58]MDZ5662627.1 hypothetical protein [Nocardioides sp. S-58]